MRRRPATARRCRSGRDGRGRSRRSIQALAPPPIASRGLQAERLHEVTRGGRATRTGRVRSSQRGRVDNPGQSSRRPRRGSRPGDQIFEEFSPQRWPWNSSAMSAFRSRAELCRSEVPASGPGSRSAVGPTKARLSVASDIDPGRLRASVGARRSPHPTSMRSPFWLAFTTGDAEAPRLARRL